MKLSTKPDDIIKRICRLHLKEWLEVHIREILLLIKLKLQKGVVQVNIYTRYVEK